MRVIKLYGHLGRKYGKVFRMNVESPAEAIRALKSNFPEFERDLVLHTPGYHVIVGNSDIGDKELTLLSEQTKCIKFVPVVQGAKKGGVLQVVLGAVLAVAGMMFQQPWLVSMGTSLVFGGIAQMLTKSAKTPTTPDEGNGGKPSYVFNGPVNTSAQGHAIQVVYGRMIVGSQVISAGLSVEEVAV